MFQLVSSATARSKREDDEDDDENLSSNPITAPPADAPDTDEGVVPVKDGGLFSNDSMISKPPKSLTKTSEKDKLEDIFDDGIRNEDHKEENSYDLDASSKILDDEYMVILVREVNGTSTRMDRQEQTRMPHKMTKNTEDVEATGEDSKGRTNNFKSHKNVRERRQKLGSRSSSHSMSTTKIMGGKKK